MSQFKGDEECGKGEFSGLRMMKTETFSFVRFSSEF